MRSHRRGLRRGRLSGQASDRPGSMTRTVRKLFTIFGIEPDRSMACPEAWSDWRRHHQHRARASHYQRQETALAPAHGHNDLRLEY